MPNRVLKDYTSSERMDKLSPQAETLFVRLIMKADDFGSFHANPKLVRSAAFPLKDKYTESHISKWVEELVKSGLIFIYENSGKKYLRIIDFGQRLRNMRNSHPMPSDDDLHKLAAIRGKQPPETKGNEGEVESETKEKGSEAQPHLFKNSEFFDFSKFETQFLYDEKYKYFDHEFYYEAVKNWSAGGKMKKDWISTARNFMLGDLKDNKPKLKKEFQAQAPSGKMSISDRTEIAKQNFMDGK